MLNLGFIALLIAAASGAPRADEFQNIDGLGFYKLYKGYDFTWGEAMTTCFLQDSHLAIINSEQEAEALKILMAENAVPYYAYIGFSDLFKQGYFVTVNGDPVEKTGYTRWEGGLPSNIAWRCGALTATGELSNRDCNEKLSFICEKDISSVYEKVPGLGYYKVHDTEIVTWGEALVKCHQEGATLAVINSEPEAEAVKQLITGLNYDLVHVGVHDMYREAFYSTVEGGKVEESGYNKWTQYEPYKTSLLNNVAVDKDGLYHLMNNTIQLPYLCEKHFPLGIKQ